MATIEINKIDETINSDVTMLAANTFNSILYQVQDSCLNYHLQISPFSAVISIKKSFVRDKSGNTILPTKIVSTCSNQGTNSNNIKPGASDVESQFKFHQEFNILQKEQEDLLKELTIAHEHIELLKKKNEEQEKTITELLRENRSAKEATSIINKAHNDARVFYEKEKLHIFKQHKIEVKSWRRELGEMTRRHIKLEKKLEILSGEKNQFQH